MTQKSFTTFSWSTVALSIILSITAWGQGVNWQIDSITAYQWFPLFGLLAWMIMATHYFNGTLRILNPELKKPSYYSKVTSYIVLACLLLHPGILAFAQLKNGAGIPPASFTDYVGESLMFASFLGSMALVLFLSYEVFERLKDRATLKKYWWLVSVSQSLAMVFIFVHALRLGGELKGWFLAIWIVYGLVLLPCFYVIHKADFTPQSDKQLPKQP